ncbi:hypothetical protein COTS27_00855 [Spirochaetota bacterium]|nr:hypothetical protein COTS27_00855 [Spirochaetota bacterium]
MNLLKIINNPLRNDPLENGQLRNNQLRNDPLRSNLLGIFVPKYAGYLKIKNIVSRLAVLNVVLLVSLSVVFLGSCTSSENNSVAAPDSKVTQLANLIKNSNPDIGSLSITADAINSKAISLSIEGLTNKSSEAATWTIKIDQDKGITTTPTNLEITASAPISPQQQSNMIKVAFGAEPPVPYTIKTSISGAPVSEWFTAENINNYLTATFASKRATLMLDGTVLTLTGLTNSFSGTGTINFNLPSGFTTASNTINLTDPDGNNINTATLELDPATFSISEIANSNNSESYTIAPITLEKLNRFTPGEHIEISRGATITGLIFTEPDGAGVPSIRIEGLTNDRQLATTPYTLTIRERPEFFMTPNNAPITITISPPLNNNMISPGIAVLSANTFRLTHQGESNPTIYALEVRLRGSSPEFWFTARNNPSEYIGLQFAGQDASLSFQNNPGDGLDVSDPKLYTRSDITNTVNGEIKLIEKTMFPPGFTLSSTPTPLLDPDGTGLAAFTDHPLGMMTITETDYPANTKSYPVFLDLKEYRSPIQMADITFNYRGLSPDIQITTNSIVISGITNTDGTDQGTFTLTTTDSSQYTIDPNPTQFTFNNPDGTDATNVELGTINVSNKAFTNVVPYTVTVRFSPPLQLKVTSASIVGGEATISAGGMITVESSRNCEFLAAPTIEIPGFPGGSVDASTPFPKYYSWNSDDTTPADTNDNIVAERNLVLKNGGTNISDSFNVKVSFPPCNTFASTGVGTSANPFEIDNAQRLELFSYLVNKMNTTALPAPSTLNFGNAHYEITAAIDLSQNDLPWSKTGGQPANPGFAPIGIDSTSNFSGTVDCGSNTISGLYINRPSADNIGLFGYATTTSAKISNCFVTGVDITGRTNVGGLIGKANDLTITSSYTTGSVSGDTSVGGLVGDTYNAAISNSYSASSVSVTTLQGGGLVGIISNSTVTSSYATGSVTATGTGPAAAVIGGLVGYNNGTSAITDSYAAGTVSTPTLFSVGGLVGSSDSGVTISNSYAIGAVSGSLIVGGLVPQTTGVTTSYWNTQTSGQTAGGGTGRTTAQMQVAAPVTAVPGTGEVDNRVYVNWDTSTWKFATGRYPRLINVVCANHQDDAAATDCTSMLQ